MTPLSTRMHASANVNVAIVANDGDLRLDVASDRQTTWTERWQRHNALVLFNPAPVT